MSIIDKVRIVRIAADTSGGDQDITISGFGTPDAVIFLSTLATLDGTVNGQASFVGFTDGTNEYCAGMRGRDNQNNEQADRYGANDGTVGNTDAQAASVTNSDSPFTLTAIITDGVRVSWTANPETASMIIVILIQCANAEVGQFTSSTTQDVATTITMSPVFAPQTVFVVGPGVTGDWNTSADFTLGVADWNGVTVEQAAMDYWVIDGSTIGNPNMIIGSASNTRIRNNQRVTTEALELNNFGSDSFDVVTRDAATASEDMGFMAIRWNSAGRKVAIFDAPTHGSTPIDKSFTWPGFKPQFVMQFLSTAQVVDTLEADADAGPGGIGVFDEDNNEECIAWAHEDASIKSNTESTHASNALELHDDAGSALFDANFANGPKMETLGYGLEFTAIPSATTRKWVGFALEEFKVAVVQPFPSRVKAIAHLLNR